MNIDANELLHAVIAKLGFTCTSSALQNILWRLHHGFISLSDLVHHHMLLVNLLEWFNKEETPNEAQVLELILLITTVSSLVMFISRFQAPQRNRWLDKDWSTRVLYCNEE
jgi:hypothetical protein